MGADVGNRISSTTAWSRPQTHRPGVKFFRLSQLRRLRGCEQVAAVCFRLRNGGIEFLLVRTNSGHWTFPKGNTEPGLTYAQAAALEAYEEAGVHGRIEEAAFAKYVRRKPADMRNSARSAERELTIQAHLCEVLRLDPPQERNRNPTWFSVEKSKRRLQEDRAPDFAAALARVVERAVTRIHRLHRESIAALNEPPKDALQKVRFLDNPRTPGKATALRISSDIAARRGKPVLSP